MRFFFGFLPYGKSEFQFLPFQQHSCWINADVSKPKEKNLFGLWATWQRFIVCTWVVCFVVHIVPHVIPPQKNRLNKHKKWKQKSCLFTYLSVVESMPSELVNPTFHCYLFVHQDHWTFVMVMNKSDICYYKSLFMKHPAAPQEIINVYRSNSFLKNEAINICGRLVFLDRIWIAL